MVGLVRYFGVFIGVLLIVEALILVVCGANNFTTILGGVMASIGVTSIAVFSEREEEELEK